MIQGSRLPKLGWLGALATGTALAWLIGTANVPRPVSHSMPASHLAAMQGQDTGARPRPTVTTQSSDDLTGMPGKKITTMLVDFPPGSLAPAHHHGGSVHVRVLSGTIRSQLEGGPPIVYRTGDSFFEPMGITHLFAENMSATEPAQALAVIVHDEGATLTTYH